MGTSRDPKAKGKMEMTPSPSDTPAEASSSAPVDMSPVGRVQAILRWDNTLHTYAAVVAGASPLSPAFVDVLLLAVSGCWAS